MITIGMIKIPKRGNISPMIIKNTKLNIILRKTEVNTNINLIKIKNKIIPNKISI